MGQVDRKKHDFDVMERVMGGVHAESDAPRPEIIRLDVTPWLAGTTVSVVQLTVRGSDAEAPERGAEASPRGEDQPRKREPRERKSGK